jgi:DNA-binding MarR family transcriptional regulator
MHILMTKKSQAAAKTLIRDARAAVESCAGWNARLAARRITRFLDERLGGSGLSLAQLGLMADIAAAADDTLRALAERVGLDQSTLSRNLRGLEAVGLVEIAIAEKDQRRRAVWLTEEGARRLESALPVWRKAHAALARRMDGELAVRLAKATRGLACDLAQPS